jgi:hypothetical protein
LMSTASRIVHVPHPAPVVDSMITANCPTSGLMLAGLQSSVTVRTTIWVQLGVGLENVNRSIWPEFPNACPQQARPGGVGVMQSFVPEMFLSSDAGLRMMQPEGGLIWAKAGAGLMLSITGAAQIKAPVRADRLRRSRRDSVPGRSTGVDSGSEALGSSTQLVLFLVRNH